MKRHDPHQIRLSEQIKNGYYRSLESEVNSSRWQGSRETGYQYLATYVAGVLLGRISVNIKKKELEKEVKKSIRATILKMFKGAWEIMVVPTGYGVKGIPDHLACVPVTITPEMVGRTYGMFLAIEAKTVTGKATPIQLLQISNIIKAGGHADVVHGTKDIERMKEAILEHYGIHQ